MATNLLPSTPLMIRASTGPVQKPDPSRRKSSSYSSNWWTPLFGMSSEADYIGSEPKADGRKEETSESDLDPKPARSRFTPGAFTEEKAKQLRMLTTETSSFHDVMYHSAIASRLASDFNKRRSDR
ncbi:uncharacterized protein LOC8269547 [Ricinus communis]|uniref:Uncharacterized protein n=1 Tax=Ricinus communis TaxID=3988 RepID=B9SEL8_RICCO|nr:uncharacterized protein LOC8269547 [Ricinus communis]EEF37877.1 conserved hypothetical protein [Ricinus communis]|eukprot:XP_002524437.1 uncharacterized protein LOC8269547 [Ricinus communis]